MSTENTETVEVQDSAVKLVNGSMELIKQLPSVFKTNKNSLLNADSALDKFIDKVEANGNKMTPELDTEAMALLVKISATTKKMNDQRTPITQIFTAISKEFTAIENELDPKKADTKTFKIQALRNQYAKEAQEEEARKERERAAKAAKAKEEGEIRAYIKNKISQNLLDYLTDKKLKVTNAFNAITLEVFEEKSTGLQNMPIDFPENKLGEIIRYDKPFFIIIHDETGWNTIRAEEHTGFDFKAFYATYFQHIKELKQSLIDRLPSKKIELEEAAEALRQSEEANRKRNREIAEAEGQRKAELEEQQRLQKIADDERQKVADDEKKQREEQDCIRISNEAEAERKRLEDQAELEKTSSTASALFSQAAEASSVVAAPESRQGYEITVLHVAGWVELFQFWYSKEGVTTPIVDFEKKNFKQVKSFAEALAKKTGEKIESKHLKYETSIKAVNRKAQ